MKDEFTAVSRKRIPKSNVILLETLYKENPNPPLAVRKSLALRLGLPQRKLQIWFQNRRAKEVREREEMIYQPTTSPSLNKIIHSSTPSCSESVASEAVEEISSDSGSSQVHIERVYPYATSSYSFFWATCMDRYKVYQF